MMQPLTTPDCGATGNWWTLEKAPIFLQECSCWWFIHAPLQTGRFNWTKWLENKSEEEEEQQVENREDLKLEKEGIRGYV